MKLVGIVVCMLLIAANVLPVTGNPNVDMNDMEIETSSDSNLVHRQPWPLRFSWDITTATTDLWHAGCEFGGGYFYTTHFSDPEIYRYDSNGNYLESFSLIPSSGLRDLAYNPSNGHFYGGVGTNVIWEMDFTRGSETIVNTITCASDVQTRALAYDEDQNLFYASGWGDPVWVIQITGTTGITTRTFNLGITTVDTYGFAYDNYCDSSGGPYLWVFDQTSGAEATIYQWKIDPSDPNYGYYTGVSHNVQPDVGSGSGYAGGLFFTSEWDPGVGLLGGVVQDDDDWLFGYEICSLDDVGILKIPSPYNGDLESDIPVEVLVCNYGTTTVTAIQITVTIEMFAAGTWNVEYSDTMCLASLAPCDPVCVSFSSWTPDIIATGVTNECIKYQVTAEITRPDSRMVNNRKYEIFHLGIGDCVKVERGNYGPASTYRFLITNNCENDLCCFDYSVVIKAWKGVLFRGEPPRNEVHWEQTFIGALSLVADGGWVYEHVPIPIPPSDPDSTIPEFFTILVDVTLGCGQSKTYYGIAIWRPLTNDIISFLWEPWWT